MPVVAGVASRNHIALTDIFSNDLNLAFRFW